MLEKVNKGLNVLKKVDSKNLLVRISVFLIMTFIVTLSYNLFLVSNNIVIGGMSGLAIIFKNLFGISIPLFLNISTVILITISFILLDKKKTIMILFGSLCYNYFVSITAPIAAKIDITFNSTFLMLLVIALIHGVCYGLIYRTGFNTGGSDIILSIMNKYLKIPMGIAGNWFNIFIIGFGFVLFGPTKTIYAVFILLVSNYITDSVTLGVKDSKMCFIKSKENEKIQDYISKNLALGSTELVSKGGIFTKRQDVLFVIVPFEEYYGFKHLVKKFDKNAFILTHDCYAVTGGYKKRLIPF